MEDAREAAALVHVRPVPLPSGEHRRPHVHLGLRHPLRHPLRLASLAQQCLAVGAREGGEGAHSTLPDTGQAGWVRLGVGVGVVVRGEGLGRGSELGRAHLPRDRALVPHLRLEELVVCEVVELPVRAAAAVRVGSSGGKGGGGEWG